MDRAEILGRYIIGEKCTVRQAAKAFGISKSTVHKDVTVQLKHIDSEIFEKVQDILQQNLSERHLRGGEATKRKFTNYRL